MLVASLLLGSAALAQQGLIIEPWRMAPVPVTLPVEPARVKPPPGLSKDRPALPAVVARVRTEPTAPSPPVIKWSPPVLELLVDPWAKARAVARAPRKGWVPQTVEIIDPWAGKAPRIPPVSTGVVGAERSTIF